MKKTRLSCVFSKHGMCICWASFSEPEAQLVTGKRHLEFKQHEIGRAMSL